MTAQGALRRVDLANDLAEATGVEVASRRGGLLGQLHEVLRVARDLEALGGHDDGGGGGQAGARRALSGGRRRGRGAQVGRCAGGDGPQAPTVRVEPAGGVVSRSLARPRSGWGASPGFWSLFWWGFWPGVIGSLIVGSCRVVVFGPP